MDQLSADKKTVGRVGYWSGLSAFCATVAFATVQLLQVAGVISYPQDEILIYGTSLCIVVPFLLEMLALHHLCPPEKKFWSHAALLFSLLYSAFVAQNYVVQLATVIPAKLRGEAGEFKMLEQSPHSLFWDYDAMGYIFMGLSSLLAVPVFNSRGYQRWVKMAFLAHALVTPLIAVVYFYPVYSPTLLYLGFPWAITAPLTVLGLAIHLKKISTEP